MSHPIYTYIRRIHYQIYIIILVLCLKQTPDLLQICYILDILVCLSISLSFRSLSPPPPALVVAEVCGGEGDVEVDESLFQNLEDLEVDDAIP